MFVCACVCVCPRVRVIARACLCSSVRLNRQGRVIIKFSLFRYTGNVGLTKLILSAGCNHKNKCHYNVAASVCLAPVFSRHI